MPVDPSAQQADMNIPVSNIRALLFDLGGVIIDVDFMRTLRFWAEAAGISPESLADRLGPDQYFEQHERGELRCDDYFCMLREQHFPGLSDQQLRDGWNATLGEEIPGVRDLVRQLAANIPVYVFSNTNPTHQRSWERSCAETLKHFREVFVSSDIGHRKPEIEAYADVAARIGCETGQILFFDDNPDNVKGARAAGMHSARIREHADLERAVQPWLG